MAFCQAYRIDLYILNLAGNKSHRFENVKTVIQDPVLFVAVLLFVKAHYQVNMLLPHPPAPNLIHFSPPRRSSNGFLIKSRTKSCLVCAGGPITCSRLHWEFWNDWEMDI